MGILLGCLEEGLPGLRGACMQGTIAALLVDLDTSHIPRLPTRVKDSLSVQHVDRSGTTS